MCCLPAPTLSPNDSSRECSRRRCSCAQWSAWKTVAAPCLSRTQQKMLSNWRTLLFLYPHNDGMTDLFYSCIEQACAPNKYIQESWPLHPVFRMLASKRDTDCFHRIVETQRTCYAVLALPVPDLPSVKWFDVIIRAW